MPCRVSSDAHEWNNEGPAVPAWYPVNPRNVANSPRTLSGIRRPRGVLLQPVAGARLWMQSVGGSLRSQSLRGLGEATLEHRPSAALSLTGASALGQRLVGSLAGAAPPRKNIKGALRSAQAGQKPAAECKGKSRPD